VATGILIADGHDRFTQVLSVADGGFVLAFVSLRRHRRDRAAPDVPFAGARGHGGLEGRLRAVSC